MDSPRVVLGGDLLAKPPLELVFPSAIGDLAALVYAALVAVLILWSVRVPRRRWIIGAMLAGGALTSAIEPLLDVLTGALHPLVGQAPVFTLMGRAIPPWVVICYAIYYGGFGALNLLAYDRGITRRGVWLWFVAPLLGDVLLEEVMLHFTLYAYYGNQPLVLIRFPLYQPAGNSVGVLIGVTMLFLLRPVLHRWRWFAAAAVAMPLGGVMGFNAVCWPSFYAVHSLAANWVVQSCGVLTWALAALMIHVISLLVAVDSPLRRSGRLVLA